MRILMMGALFLLCLVAVPSFADDVSPQTADPEENMTEETGSWASTATTYAYFVPDDHNYVSAILTGDRNWLHLEGRYNYEDIDTGSAWLGYNFSFGEKLVLDLTPMFGGVFGNLNGVAPGTEVTLSYRKLEIYTENEYVFDLEDSTQNFFLHFRQYMEVILPENFGLGCWLFTTIRCAPYFLGRSYSLPSRFIRSKQLFYLRFAFNSSL